MAKQKTISKTDFKKMKSDIIQLETDLIALEKEDKDAVEKVKKIRERMRGKKEELAKLNEKLNEKAKEYADEN